MLNFLNTTVLFAAAAALIPLIIHLFSKRKVKVVEFSSLKHLKAMQRRQVRRLKIRQLLLLLLRMLIILLVVLAFARPTTEGGNIGSHASVSAVVLFDNSASMDRYITDGNLFEAARKRTEDLLSTFGESDEIALIPLVPSSIDQTSKFTSAAIARETLERLHPVFEAADLTGGLGKAVELLSRATNLNKEVYLVTDRQRTSLPDSALLSSLQANVYLVDLPIERAENVGIVSVDFGGQLIIPGHDFTLTARMKNYSTDDQADLIASLFIDGTRIAQSDFDILSGEETVVRFSRSVSTTGFHSGYVEISDDKFLADNRYYFSFRIPERFTILIIDGDNTGQLMSLALSPAPTVAHYWSVKRAQADDLAGVNFWEYDVIALAGSPALSDTYIERLKSFVRSGKSLLITYSPDAPIEYLNDTWSEMTGVVFDEGAALNFSRAGYYTLLAIDMEHPIFSVFGTDNEKPPEIKFYTLPRVRLSDGARAIMRFTGDRPALVEHTYGSGRVLTFTGPMAPQFSDLSGSAFFVPFTSRIAEYLASDLSSYDISLTCGTPVVRNVPRTISISQALELLSPDSSVFELTPDEEQGTMLVRIQMTDYPGIYSVRYQGREVDRFALNIAARECDLAHVDPDQFGAAVGADNLSTLETNIQMASVIAELRYGKELWQLFLWLAVILLAAEVLLSKGSRVEEA